MIPNQILKVLSTLSCRNVHYLLMGGQACVLYGAAEFSVDTDITVVADAENLNRVALAMDDLQASCIAVPPFESTYLLRGHAVHFRIAGPTRSHTRIDVMAVMRGVAPFAELWDRRTSTIENGVAVELLSLPDLVRAKKTQRDKDWPMIRRLVEANYAENRPNPAPQQLDFWLRECRTPGMLLELAANFPQHLEALASQRPLLSIAKLNDEAQLAAALAEEQRLESEADRAYWAPLKAELELLRLGRRG